MPNIVLEIADITLLDFSELTQLREDNTTLLESAQNTIGGTNSTVASLGTAAVGAATDLLASAEVQAYLQAGWVDKFYGILGLVAALAIVICMVFSCGALICSC